MGRKWAVFAHKQKLKDDERHCLCGLLITELKKTDKNKIVYERPYDLASVIRAT